MSCCGFIILLCILSIVSVTSGAIQEWNSDGTTSSTCGLRPSSIEVPHEYGQIPRPPDFRIIGGQESVPLSWPWMAVLKGRREPDEFGICGASIISAHVLITAAHCMYDDKGIFYNDPNDYKVRVGAHYINGGTEYQVVHIAVHEDFNFFHSYNDIALLLVEQNMLTKDIRPVCLPENPHVDDNLTGEPVMVIGWGMTDNNTPYSNFLNEVMVKVVTRGKCAAAYEHEFASRFIYGITNTMICAGIPEEGKDSCGGDSGGPLMKEFTPNVWTAVGVVSQGRNCTLFEAPSISTRISQYLDWIRQKIEEAPL